VFLARCLAWARRAVVWIVPAQAGPRGLCFAGCLPAQWHGEDETPGIEVVLRGLAPELRPARDGLRDLDLFQASCPIWRSSPATSAERLACRAATSGVQRLLKHLRARAKPDPQGHRLDIPRKSAVLVWRHS